VRQVEAGDIRDSFFGEECPCGTPKRTKNAFCYGCYYSLPESKRRALYRRFGDGFEQAYRDAFEGNNIVDSGRLAWDDGRRWVNLLDLLRLYAESFCRLSHHLGIASIELTVDSDKDRLHGGVVKGLLEYLPAIKKECDTLGLRFSAKQIDDILDRWDKYQDKRLLSHMSHELAKRIQDELQSRVALIVSAHCQQQYEKPLAGWEEVAERFPDSLEDIEEMGRCRALDRYAASVFHSLLVVEHGIISLGKFLHVSDPKPGWDATQRALDLVIKDGHKKAPRRLKKYFSFLEQVHQSLKSMKVAWRNKISHADGRLIVIDSHFKPAVADEIIIASRAFMRRLSEGLP